MNEAVEDTGVSVVEPEFEMEGHAYIDEGKSKRSFSIFRTSTSCVSCLWSRIMGQSCCARRDVVEFPGSRLRSRVVGL